MRLHGISNWIIEASLVGLFAGSVIGCGKPAPAEPACEVGLSECGETCSDTASDPDNCGACGNACGLDQVCSNSTCTPDCAADALCGDLCVDTQTDSANCGGCNLACADTHQCVAGECAPTACVLDSFGFAATLVIENTGDALLDYTAPVSLDTAALIAAGKLAADCKDLRFVDVTGAELPYWLQSGCNTDATEVWVRIPVVAMGTSEIYAQYGEPGAAPASDGAAAFLFFDDFNDGDLSDWTAGALNFESGHDRGHAETVDAANVVSPGFSASLYAYASCLSAPFNGVTAFIETQVGLPAGDYCIEFDGRSDILDFDFSTSGSAIRQIEIDGTNVVGASASCSGFGCTASTGFVAGRAFHPAAAIDTLRLKGRASDCIEGQSWFDDVRIRNCAEVDAVVTVAAEFECL